VRYLYTAFFYLITPLILLRLMWRARLAPAYAERWSERFGFFKAANIKPIGSIWVHAVSVGETLAALPMIKALQARYPELTLVVTTTTPTGSERVRAVLGDSVFHVYAPYDLPDCLSRFIARVKPQLAIIMETELWPNTIHACHQRDIPVVVANARLSAKSARGYQRFAALAQPMLSELSVVAAQHQDDASRFQSLGLTSEQSQVTGSIKFDITIDEALNTQAEALRQDWGVERPILLAASTHLGEDEKVLEAFAAISRQQPDALLVLVPRHPERFGSVADLCRQQFTVQKRSDGGPVEADTQVLVGDTMGEMMKFFGACDIAFMGGSWIESGGHNMIEPAAWGKPILSGPSLFNFAEVSRLLIEAQGMQVVDNPAQLAESVVQLIGNTDQQQAMGQKALAVADANRGALDRLLAIIAGQLVGKNS
jgi:3-deoxy-D-manno-octulosonic-acid transferase